MTRSIPNSSIGSRYKNRMLVVGGHDGAKHLRLGQLMPWTLEGSPTKLQGLTDHPSTWSVYWKRESHGLFGVCNWNVGYMIHTYIYNILIYINNILYYKYILLYMYTLPVLLSSHFAGCIRIFMASFFSCSSRSPQHKQGSPSFGCQEWLLPVQFRLTRVPEPSRWKHQVLGARIEVQRSSSSTESGT